jgi:lysophospholipase
MTTLSCSPSFIAASDGALLRTVVFEAEKARGVCVLLQGQCEFIEKYVEVVGELNARGFTVATLDWRGQGGSARALRNTLKAHADDFAEYDDDLASFLDQVVRPLSPEPPVLVAHSMGAHIAIRALHDRLEAFRAAVLVSPMLALNTRGIPAPLARIITTLHLWAGLGSNFVWGAAGRDPLLADFTTQPCTTDRKRFARTQAIIKTNPSIRLAGPTWSWLAAAARSMAQTTAPGYAEAIGTPLLILGAGRDRMVKVEATREFAARLKHGTYVEIENAEHEILMEQNAIRTRFWQAFDDFVARTL